MRLEAQYERMNGKVDDLSAVVARVELNQNHAEELNKLRFDAVNQSIVQVEAKLDKQAGLLGDFMSRIERIMTGELDTAQTRQGQALVADYQKWRTATDDRLDQFEMLSTQVRFFARIAVTFTGTSLIATACALYVAFIK